MLNDAVICQADGRQVIDDAEDEIRLARKHLLEGKNAKIESELTILGYKSEKQRGRDYVEKLSELETKAKEEADKEEEAPIAMITSTRSKPAKKVKLTAKEELENFMHENDQLKEAQERQVEVLNEKLTRMELTIRAQLLGTDRFHRR